MQKEEGTQPKVDEGWCRRSRLNFKKAIIILSYDTRGRLVSSLEIKFLKGKYYFELWRPRKAKENVVIREFRIIKVLPIISAHATLKSSR